MGWIEKRERDKGTAWKAATRGPDGATRSKTFTRQTDAKRWLAAQEHAMASGSWVNPDLGKVTFGAYAASWAAQQPHRPSTAATVGSRLRTHLLPALGERPLASIRPSDMRSLVGSLSKALAPGTVQVVYRLAATIFRAAVEDGHLVKTPCPARMALPRPDGHKVEPMTVEEVHAMAESVDERYGAAVIAGGGLGLRQAELFGLTVDRVDWLRRTVRVDRQLLTLVGSAPAFAPVKTEASVRTIPAPTVVLEAFTAHLRAFGEGPDRLIFSTAEGRPVRPEKASMVWRRGAARSGLPGKTGWHDLRHFYASLLIQAGGNVKVLQSRLGHKSALVTLDTYGHLWPDSEDATRAAVDRLLGAPAPSVLPAEDGKRL